MVQLSHPHMTTGKTIALTRGTFAGKVMSLLTLSRFVMAFLPRSSEIAERKGLASPSRLFFCREVGGTSCVGLTQTHCRPHTARKIVWQVRMPSGGRIRVGHPDAYIFTYSESEQERQRKSRSPPSTGSSQPTSSRDKTGRKHPSVTGERT